MWTLLLLAATVRSFAYMPLGISDRNKMVLWPGSEGCAELSLHTKNVRSVQFVVKRRGCCCNLSVVLRWMCDSPQTGCAWRTTPFIYVARTSNNRVIMACELYCCLLPQCEALRICRSGFPIATAPKLLHSWRHTQKICNPQPKIFFRVQTRKLADPFEPLISSLAQLADELWRW